MRYFLDVFINNIILVDMKRNISVLIIGLLLLVAMPMHAQFFQWGIKGGANVAKISYNKDNMGGFFIGPSFKLLNDPNNELAKELGIAFKVSDELSNAYLGFGIDIDDSQGNSEKILDRKSVV